MTGEVETPNSETPVTPTETPALIDGVTTEETTTEEATTTEKTPEQVAEEAAAAEAETARLAPLTVEGLVLPEGMESTDELKSEFVETVNKLNELGPAAAAEALLNLQAKALTAASEASSAEWNKLQEGWRDQVKADYGERLQPTLNSINNLVKEHGDEKLVEALATTGAGNNPEVVKFFAKMATMLTEGGYAPGSPANSEKSAAQRLYPSMPN